MRGSFDGRIAINLRARVVTGCGEKSENTNAQRRGEVVDLFLEGRSHSTTTMTMTTATTTGRVVFKLIKKLPRRMKNPTTYKTSLRESMPHSNATPVAIALAVALVPCAKKKGKKSTKSTPFRSAFIYLGDELDCFSIYLNHLFHDLALKYFLREYKQANSK